MRSLLTWFRYAFGYSTGVCSVPIRALTNKAVLKTAFLLEGWDMILELSVLLAVSIAPIISE
jgi:hypothetical protein